MIIHRYFPCNSIINIWHQQHNKKCADCNEVDTIEHYFFECHLLANFWNLFSRWWARANGANIHLSTFDIIFGIQNNFSDHSLYTLNFCIMQAKYTIYQWKLKSNPIQFDNFVTKLRNRIDTEKYIYTINSKMAESNEQWHDIYGFLLDNNS